MSARPSVRAGTRSYALMQALRMLIAFGVASLVARQLGAEGKGALALVQQVPSIMALVFGFGFAGVNVFFVGSGRKSVGEALGDSLSVAVVALVLGVPLSWALMRALPALDGFSGGLLLLAAFVVPAGVLSSQLGAILVGGGRPSAQARAQSVGLIINGLAVAALYLAVRLSVGAAVAASLAATVVTVGLVVVAIRERAVLKGTVGRLRDAAQYARKRYLTEVAAMLEMRVDIVMLGILATAAAAGVYSVAVALVEMLWFIPRAAETPLLSRLLHEGEERGAELTAQAVRLTVALELVLLIGALVLLGPAIRLLFGPAFVEALPLFWILVPGIVMNALVGPILSYLTSRGHQYPALAGATVGGNIALNAALIPVMGVTGAALASSVTYALGSLWLMARFTKETGVGLSALVLPRASDVRALLRRA